MRMQSAMHGMYYKGSVFKLSNTERSKPLFVMPNVASGYPETIGVYCMLDVIGLNGYVYPDSMIPI